MSEPAPGRPEARAALAEADTQAAKVRRADRRLAWFLFAFAAVYVAGYSVMSLWRSTSGVIALLVIVAVGCFLLIWLGVRVRAYSRSGIGWAFGAIVAFFIWSNAVSAVSFVMGWWGPQHPIPSAINSAVGAIPLIVGALVLGRR